MTRANRLHDMLWRSALNQDIWMILDCARDPQRIFRFLVECHLENRCLYGGNIPPALEMAAPYLVQLERDADETHRLIDMAWGNSWGVFLSSAAALTGLRRHLREFLMVRDGMGRRMAFRYYDPRVLRCYLPTCTRSELATVFGPIKAFWTEDEDSPDQVLEFGYPGENLRLRQLPLFP